MFTFNRSRIKRLILSFVTVLLPLSFMLKASEYNCHLDYIEEPPFWVVVGDNSMKGKEYENLKGEEEDAYRSVSRNNQYTIPKRSIVIRDPDRPTVENTYNSQQFMPVVVVSTPTNQDEKKNLINAKVGGVSTGSRRQQAEPGTRGYIYAGAVRQHKSGEEYHVNPSVIPPGKLRESVQNGSVNEEHVFVVKKDSAHLVDIPGVDSFDQTHTLQLNMSNGKYLVNICENTDNNEDVKISYFFNVFKHNKDGSKVQVSHLEFDPINGCQEKALSALLPIAKSQYLPLLSLANASGDQNKGIEDVLFLEGKKLAQIPQSRTFETDGQCYTVGPYGTFHYIGFYGKCERNSVKKEANADSMLKPHAACAAMGALKKVSERCPDCIIQWGDAFWPKGRHSSHHTGLCIDFRPVKKDQSVGIYNIGDDLSASGNYRSNRRKENGLYSRDRSQILVEEMMKAGADLVLFNDTKLDDNISPEVKKYTNYRGDPSTKRATDASGNQVRVNVPFRNRSHSNHLHICFPKEEHFDAEKLKERKAELLDKTYRTQREKNELNDLEVLIARAERMQNSCRMQN